MLRSELIKVLQEQIITDGDKEVNVLSFPCNMTHIDIIGFDLDGIRLTADGETIIDGRIY